ncbi:MAG: hypothetical protein CMP33_06585 [Rickettsiales bacterium]|nr:hypothetical protein [Rickettsiales bacterium]
MIVLKGTNESIDLYHKITKTEEIKKIQYCLIDQNMLAELSKYETSKNHYFGLKLFSSSSLIDNFSDYISKLSLIEIEFESFKDGRPFTIAKDLRQILNFKGELRASGSILPDQYIFLCRCGFSSVKIDEEQKKTWIEIYNNDPGLKYQVD